MAQGNLVRHISHLRYPTFLHCSDRHNRKFGYICKTRGSQLHISFAHSSNSSMDLVVYLSYLKSYDDMGDAHVSCIQGCSCRYTQLHGAWTTHASVTKLEAIELSELEEGSNCTMQVVHKGGWFRFSKFKLSGFMLTEKDNLLHAADHGFAVQYAAE